jgi:hypothetical protein
VGAPAIFGSLSHRRDKKGTTVYMDDLHFIRRN